MKINDLQKYPVQSVYIFIYYNKDGSKEKRSFYLCDSVNLIVCNINVGVEIKWDKQEGKEFVKHSERFQLLGIEQLDYEDGSPHGRRSLVFHIQDIPESFSTGFKEPE